MEENGHDRTQARCLSSPLTVHTLLGPRHIMARPRDTLTTRRGGMERLQDNHYKKGTCWPPPPTKARKTCPCSNVLGARRQQKKEGGQRRHGEVHSRKTWKRWVSADMVPTRSPVTFEYGFFSSPMLREEQADLMKSISRDG